MKNRASTEYRNTLRKNLAGVLSELRETCVADYTKPEGGLGTCLAGTVLRRLPVAAL
mgnify:CR=1 FL=1|jgi:hypothetical protein